MADIKLVGILKLICEEVEGQQACMKFDPQTMRPCSAPSCKANTDWQSRSDNADVISTTSNMPDYFRSNTDREADKRAGQLTTQRTNNELSDNFTRIRCSDDTFRLQVKKGSWPYQASHRRVVYVV